MSSCSRKFFSSSSPSSSSSVPEWESDSTLHSSAINKCTLETEEEEEKQTDGQNTIDKENRENCETRSEETTRTLDEHCEDVDMSKHNDVHINSGANSNNQKKNNIAMQDQDTNSSITDKSSKEHDNDKDEVDDNEEANKIHIYNPEYTAEERERKEKTKLFLTILLTSQDFQECKDMLVAALRCQTFKEHHLLALLRDVKSTRFDDVAAVKGEQKNDHIDRCNEPHSHNGKMNKTKSTCINNINNDSDTYTIPHTTATDRLRRVRDIIQFTCEEGYEAGGESPFRPEATTIHTLLTQLLKAATINASHNDNNNNNIGNYNDKDNVTMCSNDNERNNGKQTQNADYVSAAIKKVDDNNNINYISDEGDDNEFQTFGNTKNLLPISHSEESNTHCKKEEVQSQSKENAKGVTIDTTIENEDMSNNSTFDNHGGKSDKNNNNQGNKDTTLMSVNSLPIVSASEV